MLLLYSGLSSHAQTITLLCLNFCLCYALFYYAQHLKLAYTDDNRLPAFTFLLVKFHFFVVF